MPTFPWHTSCTICELLLSWNTSLRSRSAGVSCGEGWKTAAILQNQDFCLMYSYVTVGIMGVCRLAAVGSAGMYHARKPNQTTDKVWQKGRVFFPPSPTSKFKEQKMILSNFKWVLLCISASVTPKRWSETYGTWEQKNPCKPCLCDTCKINLFCFYQLLMHIALQLSPRGHAHV